MGDLRTCSPEEFLEVLGRCSLDEKRVLIEELPLDPGERSVIILLEILQGDSWYLRDLAGKAITQIGEVAVPGLLALLRSGLWYTRAAAARVLGRLGYAEALPQLVRMLADPNQTVQGACLASIADLVREGHAKETARLFWNEGARRAEELGRVLTAVRPDAGRAVSDLLGDPSSFLREEPAVSSPEAEAEPPVTADRKNA
jgi:HEAT repeat protein